MLEVLTAVEALRSFKSESKGHLGLRPIRALAEFAASRSEGIAGVIFRLPHHKH